MSTLEPLLGTLLGSLWCPLNHISLSFPIWVHVLSPWTREYTFLVWKWIDFKFFQELWWPGHGCSWFLTEWVREERSDSWLKLSSFLSHHFQLYITWEIIEFQLVEEGFNPWWTRVLFWFDWTSWDLMGMGSSYLVVLDFGWSAHVTSCCWNLCVSWAGPAGLCS